MLFAHCKQGGLRCDCPGRDSPIFWQLSLHLGSQKPSYSVGSLGLSPWYGISARICLRLDGPKNTSFRKTRNRKSNFPQRSSEARSLRGSFLFSASKGL